MTVRNQWRMEKWQRALLATNLAMAFVGCLSVAQMTNADEGAALAFDGAKSSWHEGFDRYDYLMDGETLAIAPFQRPADEKFNIGAPSKGARRCVVICPKTPAPGRPWSWRGCYWDHQPQTEIALLKKGFHIAYITADHTLRPDKHWEAWYEYLTTKHGLSPKPAFVGMSRGGEYSFTWATTHPDKVSCIYADNSGGNEEMMGKIGALVKADVPIMLVCGTIDPILSKFSLPIESIYQNSGGRVSMILKEGAGHHPHSLHDPTPMADFIEQSVKETPPTAPDFVGNNPVFHSYYYSGQGNGEWSEKNGYYLVRRGPAFSPCYDQWAMGLGFSMPVTIVAPKKEAAGRPWVYRAGYVRRDATVDQELLAKGYHVVVGPIGFGADGMVMEEWDKLYSYLTEHGFAKKPVMEGEGGAAATVYAWAEAHADQVRCIFAENPIFRVGGTEDSIIEGLSKLAQAHVRVLHVCDTENSFAQAESTLIGKNYRDLGGEIRVNLVGNNVPNGLTRRGGVSAAEFIEAHR